MILVSGCFDGLHAGHLHYLEQARRFADGPEALAVALASDDYIRVVKGREPRWTWDDRARVLSGLKMDFEIYMHGSPSVANLLGGLRPRVFVKGEDWRGQLTGDVVTACGLVGAEVRFIPAWPCRHSSAA